MTAPAARLIANNINRIRRALFITLSFCLGATRGFTLSGGQPGFSRITTRHRYTVQDLFHNLLGAQIAQAGARTQDHPVGQCGTARALISSGST